MGEIFPRRKSIRLPGYDYSQVGAYFVTMVIQDRKPLLGVLEKDIFSPNQIGQIVADTWMWLGDHYAYITMDEYCLMPNHLHGILIIDAMDPGRGGSRAAPTRAAPTRAAPTRAAPTRAAPTRAAPTRAAPTCAAPTRAAPTANGFSAKIKPLGQIIGAFKTVSTKQVNFLRGTPGLPLWQRNYYEHIIRDDNDLSRVREYILNNPLAWSQDGENPGDSPV